MKLSQVALQLISASVGAASAIGGQMFANIHTSKRETKRLAWEKDKFSKELELRQSEKFLDLKRELYSKFIGTTYDIVVGTSVLMPETEEESDEDLASVIGSYLGTINLLKNIYGDISLLSSSELSDKVMEFITALVETHYMFSNATENPFDMLKRQSTIPLGLWWDLRILFRNDLIGFQENFDKLISNLVHPKL